MHMVDVCAQIQHVFVLEEFKKGEIMKSIVEGMDLEQVYLLRDVVQETLEMDEMFKGDLKLKELMVAFDQWINQETIDLLEWS